MKISESFNMRWKRKNIQRWEKKFERLRQKKVSKANEDEFGLIMAIDKFLQF